MKRILLVAAATLAIAATAQAADIRPPPPTKAPPAFIPPPIFTWAGFYLGANVGYGWADGDGTVSPPATRFTGDGDGVFGGFQIGYNWQTGAFVYGLETDFQLSAGDGTVQGGGPLGLRANVDNEWFGTIRGRLGYAVDRWLFYVTGGGAYVHNKATGTFGGVPFRSTETGWTWTVGGGVEWAMWQNWSAKLEYLYFAEPDDVPRPPGTSVDGNGDTHTIRVGVNYRFPW
jgi:outer membrane immunogenic protein